MFNLINLLIPYLIDVHLYIIIIVIYHHDFNRILIKIVIDLKDYLGLGILRYLGNGMVVGRLHLGLV